MNNPFPPDIETQTATQIPDISFKKKATSLDALRNNKPTTTTHTRSTPIASLSSPNKPVESNPVSSEPMPEPMPEPEPTQEPTPESGMVQRNEEEEQQPNYDQMYGIGDTEVAADWVEVPEHLFLLKAFPALLPPDVGFPIVTFWMIICLCISFYGRHEWIRKGMITLLSIILYTIIKHWYVYLALWNEGIYSDPWFDGWITTSMFSTAQSPKEAKGILFFIFLCFMFILQIFLYFYV